MRRLIAFDATGGGKLAGQILTCMEAALNRTATEYSRYSKEISLAEALQPKTIAVYAQRATGTKYLINPSKAAKISA